MTRWERDVCRIERRLRKPKLRFTQADRDALAECLSILRRALAEALLDNASTIAICNPRRA